MKTKMTKKVFAVLIAMALVFGMALTAFAVTGAPTTGSLTVTGDKEFVGKTVSAYQVFTANWEDTNETGTDDNNIDLSDNISYVLNTNWEGFFTDAMLTGITGVSKSDKAAQYVAGLNDAQMLQLAKDMKAYADTNNIAATYTSGLATETATGGSVTITGMTPGYYLVIPEGGSTSTTRGTDATLVNVPSAASASWAIKSDYPTVEKTVGTNETETTAKIGDVLDFKLESHVPDMTEYTTYTFKFHDTFSTGLTYTGDTDLAVTIAGKTLVQGTDYTVAYDTSTRELTVDLTDLKALVDNDANINEGSLIVVTYKAMLNENAVIAGTGNKNTATVEYSNDPATGGTGTSTPTETKTYTYQLTIDKNDGSGTKLAGAEFKLKSSAGADGTVIRLISTGTENEYRVANADEIAVTPEASNRTVSTVTTTATGLIIIKGLEAGTTYYLEEVTAPVGYNKLANDITIFIDPTVTGGSYTAPIYSVGGVAQGTSSTANVVNTKGTMLPTTGGIGTIGLTALGVGVVIFGFVFTSKKKKKAE